MPIKTSHLKAYQNIYPLKRNWTAKSIQNTIPLYDWPIHNWLRIWLRYMEADISCWIRRIQLTEKITMVLIWWKNNQASFFYKHKLTLTFSTICFVSLCVIISLVQFLFDDDENLKLRNLFSSDVRIKSEAFVHW